MLISKFESNLLFKFYADAWREIYQLPFWKRFYNGVYKDHANKKCMAQKTNVFQPCLCSCKLIICQRKEVGRMYSQVWKMSTYDAELRNHNFRTRQKKLWRKHKACWLEVVWFFDSFWKTKRIKFEIVYRTKKASSNTSAATYCIPLIHYTGYV